MSQLTWLAYVEYETYLSKMYYPDPYPNPSRRNKPPMPNLSQT